MFKSPKLMPEITLHIINPLNTLNIVPVNTGNVEVNDVQYFVKQKTSHKKCATPNSILTECFRNRVRIKLFLQDRKIQTLSVPATYAKGNYFLINVVTKWCKSYNITYKRCTNTIIWYKTQFMLVVKNLATITAKPFLKIEGKPSKLLQSFKFFKSEKNYTKKAQYTWAFFGTTKVFR